MNLSKFIELLFTKVKLNLKAEAAKSYLSYCWWVLEPAMYVSVFYLVFGIFLAANTEDFVIFLICGNIPFLWFSRTVGNTSSAIIAGRGLMNQIAIPKIFFPMVIICQDSVKTSVIFLLMISLVALYGFEIKITWLALFPLMIAQFCFVAAIALVGAALVPFVPDLRFVIQTGIMLTMFASGIFYSYEDVILPEHQQLFLLNPMANLIKMYREVLMLGIWPSWGAIFTITLGSMAVISLMVVVYKKVGAKYPRLVLQ